MGKRILVTGAGGYIGRHVVSALCDKGAEVLTVDFRTDGIDNRAEILAENIFSGSKTIYQELGNPDVCIHMALYMTPMPIWRICRLITGFFKG